MACVHDSYTDPVFLSSSEAAHTAEAKVTFFSFLPLTSFIR